MSGEHVAAPAGAYGYVFDRRVSLRAASAQFDRASLGGDGGVLNLGSLAHIVGRDPFGSAIDVLVPAPF
jgi:hypothetical protein